MNKQQIEKEFDEKYYYAFHIHNLTTEPIKQFLFEKIEQAEKEVLLSLKNVYIKYKHLDEILSDTSFDKFESKISADIYNTLKQTLKKYGIEE